MNTVLKAVWDKWGDTSDLTDLIAKDRVFTSLYFTDEEKYPFVTIVSQGTTQDLRDNTNCYVEQENISLGIYVANDTGDREFLAKVALQVRRAFFKWDATLDNDEGGISDTIVESAGELQEPDTGYWTHAFSLNLTVTRNVI